MASLSGVSVASSYTSLLKLNGNTDTLVDGDGSNAIQVVDGDGTISPLFLNKDRLGIGIQPATALDVSGGLNSAHSTFSGQAGRGLLIETQSTTNNDDTVVLNAQTSTGEIAFETNSTERMRLKSDGELIVTPSGANLDVSGAPNGSLSLGSPSSTLQASVLGRTTSNATALHLFASATDANTLGDMRFNVRENNDSSFATLTNPAFKFIHYTTDLVTILRDGSVGINTDPESALHLNTTSSGGIGGKLIIDNQASDADGNGTEISFFNAAGASASGVSSSRIRSVASGNTNGYSQLQFWTYHASEGQRMTLSSDGKLGIGTTSPDALLDLTSSTGYANLRLGQNKTNESAQRAGISAQPYLTAEEPTAGMFMFIDGTGSTQDTADLQLGGGHGSFNAVKQIKFYTASDAVTTSGTEVMRLDANSRISLSNNGGGDNNTIFGYQAGMNVTTNGDENTFVGHTAGVEVTTGEDNTGIGWRSIFDIKEGGFNTAVGSSSLGGQHGSTADASAENVAIGYSAMGGNFDNSATTDQCVAVGALTMNGALNNVDGTVAVGYKSLTALTSGASNVAVGYQSADALTTGAQNTAIGDSALGATVDGTSNTAVGAFAMSGGDAHLYNTGIGSQSLSSVTGSSNTGIGFQAGQTGSNNITSGINNTLIGSQTATNSATADNQTVIGQGATGQGDNTVTLGNSSVTKVYVGAGGTDQSIVFKDSAEQGKIRYDHNNEQFQIFVGGSEKIKFETGGDIRLLDGGINFPDDASNSASSDANTLDDYEEGDQTVTVVGASSGNYVVNSTNNKWRYTKIGRLVNIQGLIIIDSDNSTSGQLRITLPFTIGDGTGLSGRSYGSAYLTAHGGTIAGRVYAKLEEGNAFFTLVEVADDGTDNDISDSDVDGAFNIGVNFSYTV